MAKVPGVWRARSKVSEVESPADRRRTEERLASIFGMKFESLESEATFEDGADGVDDHATPARETALAEHETQGSETGAAETGEAEPVAAEHLEARPRPGIIVVGSRDLVPVMAAGEAAPRDADPREDWDAVVRWPLTTLPDEGPVALEAVAHKATVIAEPEPEVLVPGPAEIGTVPAPAKAAAPANAARAKSRAAAPANAARAKSRTTTPAKAKPQSAAPAGAARAKSRTAAPTKAAKAKAATTIVAWCPSCAIPLEPAPTSSRRCAQCRQRIIVKRFDGRTVLLAEAVLPVFEAERRRVANASRLTRECQRWLRLAAIAGAPAERVEARALAAVARPSEEAVAASRALYLGSVERAYQEARRERRWEDASRIRRDHALVLHRDAGSPVPPSEVVLKLHRDAMAAALRGIAEIIRDAELVAATCCDGCRADDRRIVRISAELRAPSLPHEACPKGVCGCRWDLPTRHRATLLRQARRRANAAPRGPRDQAAPAT